MNLVINYDFFNAIKDVNEGFTLSKITRNNINKWLSFNIPLLTSLEYVVAREKTLQYLPSAIAVHFFIILQLELIEYKAFGDLYKEISDTRLKSLVNMLSNINIETTYDLLKESECYHKVNNLKLNEKKIPQLIQSKYILVPNYDNKGDVVETSILQEHVVGSKTYVLSLGSPSKVLKPAYSKI